MRSQLIIKSLLGGFLLLLIQSQSLAQNFQVEKYDKEYSPYFKFNQFKRGEKSEVLSKRLDELESMGRREWTFDDSLEFAEISLLTGNIKLAEYYLNRLNNPNKKNFKALKLLLVAYYIQLDYSKGKAVLDAQLPNPPLHSQAFFIKSIFLSVDSVNPPSPFILNIWNENTFNIRKGSEQYKSKLITPIKNARSALEFYVLFIHEKDPRLAKCFNELGLILENKVSLNQAYIAYSIARIYNKKDADILENVKRIKAKHIQKNYNTPNFRKYFPRIEYWRFDYDILKEKIISEKNDTIPKFVPNLVGPTTTIQTPFPKDVIVPAGFLVMIILIILFTRTRKK